MTEMMYSRTIWKRVSRMLPDESTTKTMSARPSQPGGNDVNDRKTCMNFHVQNFFAANQICQILINLVFDVSMSYDPAQERTSLAEPAGSSRWTDTREAVDAVDAGGATLARITLTLVHSCRQNTTCT